MRIQRCLGTSKLMLSDSGHKSTNLWQKYKTKKITFLGKGDLDFSTGFLTKIQENEKVLIQELFSILLNIKL